MRFLAGTDKLEAKLKQQKYNELTAYILEEADEESDMKKFLTYVYNIITDEYWKTFIDEKLHLQIKTIIDNKCKKNDCQNNLNGLQNAVLEFYEDYKA